MTTHRTPRLDFEDEYAEGFESELEEPQPDSEAPAHRSLLAEAKLVDDEDEWPDDEWRDDEWPLTVASAPRFP